MGEELFRRHKPAFVLMFGLFALWGLGHRLYDTLVPEFSAAFSLDSFQLVVTQSAYSLVYFLFAIPAALYSRVFGSKAGIVFGLGSWGVGAFLFYPAAQQSGFLYFLFAAALMSCGYIFVEIAVNPVVVRMGPPESAVRRLNFAHALYPLGVLLGLYVGRWVILSNLELPVERVGEAIIRPYMVLGAAVLALAFLADKLHFPALATKRSSHRGVFKEYRELLRRPSFLAAVGAQFCNVGAMAGTWTLSAWYIQSAVPDATPTVAANYLLASIVVFGLGRFAGAILLYWIRPETLLAAFAASGLALAAVATATGGQTGVYAVVASSFSVSIMFATVLGIAVRDLGPLTKSGTALIYMGGAGSAIAVALMHLVWTMSSIQLAMLVPATGYAGVLAFAFFQRRTAAATRHAGLAQAAE